MASPQKNIEPENWVVLGIKLQHAQDVWGAYGDGLVDFSQHMFFTFEILKFLTKVNTLQISYKLGVCDIGKSTFTAVCLEGIEAAALRVWKWHSCCWETVCKIWIGITFLLLFFFNLLPG